MDIGTWQATVHGIARVGQDLTLSFVDSKRYWNKIYVCLIAYIAIGEGNGNPLQCSCLENPRDGGAWWAAVYGVAQSQTRLKGLSSSSSSSRLLCPWDLPGKNTGLGCHFFLQGIFLAQGSNPCLLCLLHWQKDSLPLSYLLLFRGLCPGSEAEV